MRRVVSLFLPMWSTDRYRKNTGDAPPRDKPLVMATKIGSRRVIVTADKAAQALGLRPGLTAPRSSQLGTTHSRLWRTCGAVRECRLPPWSAWPKPMRTARSGSVGGKPYGRCGRLAANRSPLPRQINGVDRYSRKSRKSGSS